MKVLEENEGIKKMRGDIPSTVIAYSSTPDIIAPQFLFVHCLEVANSNDTSSNGGAG